MTKQKALSQYLNVTEDSIKLDTYSEKMFYWQGQEYLVLSDKEANEYAEEYILQSVWAFKADFIIDHSRILTYDKASYSIVHILQNECEGGNDAMKKLIDNLDVFVQDAIKADGRGHFISQYDGQEIEHGDYFIYRVN